ncbi:hypothetical protein PF0782 [Pyrococcus furiosus DSM 3638]|uniref:Uncharacterized protein n=2 Tax=Pyrococcus furiosus TaxID=2261 RepID=Q8U2Q1_PYRFU|nr:hypothetical protein PF0782 [Pyrococcus furiosus DSM 3638]
MFMGTLNTRIIFVEVESEKMGEASRALQRISRGTGIIFAGTVISMLFSFLSRAIIARNFSTSEYGVFNLALTVLSIALVIATLGFYYGVLWDFNFSIPIELVMMNFLNE